MNELRSAVADFFDDLAQMERIVPNAPFDDASASASLNALGTTRSTSGDRIAPTRHSSLPRRARRDA
jgi:hypothetical protein